MTLSILLALLLQTPEPAPLPVSGPAVVADTASLTVGNRVVMVFRTPLGAARPAERAAAARSRIDRALEAGADSVSTAGAPEGTLVLLGSEPMFTVTAGDADTLGGGTVEGRTRAAAQELALAVGEVREARSITRLLAGIALVLLATVLLAIILQVIFAARRKAAERLQSLAGSTLPAITLRGFTLVRRDQLLGALRGLLTVVTWGLGVVSIYVYATFALTRFAWTRPWGQALGGYLVSLLGRLGLGALSAIPDLFVVAVIILLTRFVADVVKKLFEAAETGSLLLPGIHPETAHPTRRIVTALIWLFAIVVAYPYLPGSDSAAFKGVSVFAGLLVTLGSAGLVGQAMSGLVVMYSRSFKVGDYIQVGETTGTVVALGMLSTRVRTTKNEYVTIPNGVVVSGRVVNYSAPRDAGHTLTIYSSVTIGYDVPWRKVHDLLLTAAHATDGALQEPAPYVLQQALNDWYVEYQVNVAVDPSRAGALPRLYSELHGRIQDAFWAAGVEIMSPSYFALRDGNTVTIPPEQRPKERTSAFRVNVNPGA